MNTVHINAGGIAFLCACRHFEGGFMKDAINLIEVPNHDRGTVKRQKVTAFSRTPAGATEGSARRRGSIHHTEASGSSQCSESVIK
jgi:hypothetical protein